MGDRCADCERGAHKHCVLPAPDPTSEGAFTCCDGVDPFFICVNECVRKGTDHLARATHGSFCDREFRAARKALELTPALVEHVLSMVGVKGAAGEKVDGSREAPLPLNVTAFNDANTMYQRLVYWARVFADHLGVQAPGPAVRAWRDMNGTIIGLPYGITPSGGRYAAGVIATWLGIHLEPICALPAVDDVNYFLTGAGQLREIFTINARWPTEVRPYFSRIPCPDDRGRIAVYPPKEFGGDTVYRCERCGRLFDEDRHAFYGRLFAEVVSEPDRVKRHLLRKYGGA